MCARAGAKRTPQPRPTPDIPLPGWGWHQESPQSPCHCPHPTPCLGTTCSPHPNRSKTHPGRDTGWAPVPSQPNGTTRKSPAPHLGFEVGTQTRLPEPTGSAGSQGRCFGKTFVPLLHVMKPAGEHETACGGWEHPGRCAEDSWALWERTGAPRPAHALPGQLPPRQHNTQRSPAPRG